MASNAGGKRYDILSFGQWMGMGFEWEKDDVKKDSMSADGRTVGALKWPLAMHKSHW